MSGKLSLNAMSLLSGMDEVKLLVEIRELYAHLTHHILNVFTDHSRDIIFQMNGSKK